MGYCYRVGSFAKKLKEPMVGRQAFGVKQGCVLRCYSCEHPPETGVDAVSSRNQRSTISAQESHGCSRCLLGDTSSWNMELFQIEEWAFEQFRKVSHFQACSVAISLCR